MNLLLINIALALPLSADTPNQAPAAQGQPMATQKLDGDWTVTYAEAGGKKIENKGFTDVRIKNNVVTCMHNGKEQSWQLQFGPHNMVRCTELSSGKATTNLNAEKGESADRGYTHHGVYIASPEYFCLCLNKGRDMRRASAQLGAAAPQNATTNQQGAAGQQGATDNRFGEHGAYRGQFVLILHRSGDIQTTGVR